MSRVPRKPVEQLAPVAEEVLDQFGPAAGMLMEEIDAATRRLKKALMERLGGELSHHLGYPPRGQKPSETSIITMARAPRRW
jgi:putative transposase